MFSMWNIFLLKYLFYWNICSTGIFVLYGISCEFDKFIDVRILLLAKF